MRGELPQLASAVETAAAFLDPAKPLKRTLDFFPRVEGVLLSRGTYIALVQAPDGKTFTAHVNDKLVDGTVRSITPQGLVIMQEVNDPLSLIKQKEVRKGLRTSDDGKQ